MVCDESANSKFTSFHTLLISLAGSDKNLCSISKPCYLCSAGKSFVAEVLMLRRVITTGKMALLVLPYVSICAEKVSFIILSKHPTHCITLLAVNLAV